MDVHTSTLPDDPDELKALLLEQFRINAEQQRLIDQQAHCTPAAAETEKLKAKVQRQKTRIEILEDQLRLIREHQFGKRSEKLNNINQWTLFNEAEIAVDDAPPDAQDETNGEDVVHVPAHTRKTGKSAYYPRIYHVWMLSMILMTQTRCVALAAV